jgi:hypothetical protein
MSTEFPAFADTADIDGALLADLETEFAFATLTGNDRCDADSAEAAVAQVLVPSVNENGKATTTVLRFCGSHWRKNASALSDFPHSVPEEDAKPFTHRRAAELGLAANRNKGGDHA